MTVTRNPSALTLADLNTTINHEPRIKDVRIGERLGMARPTNIRQTIEANMAELGRNYFGADDVPDLDGVAHLAAEPVRGGRFKMMPEVRILGRVLSVEAL
ncbi:MAG: hypothetical protein RBR34_08410 [Rhodospirillaceae bacterium]|nr:hypothetical protein [Rhodospirillaceae bacterium]